MTEKIQVPVLSKEQKIELFNKVMTAKVVDNLPNLSKNYRWNLKISKDVFLVFELELQKKEVLFWKRSKGFNISLQNIKDSSSVESYLQYCANDLLDWEEKDISEDPMENFDWIIDGDLNEKR